MDRNEQRQQILNTFTIVKDEQKNFFIQQFYTKCIAEAAYYVESEGEAFIIDPLRDTFPYILLAEERKAKITKVFLTHFHADFVSGHLDLQRKLDCEIIFGPTAQAKYEITVGKHEQIYKLGKIEFQLLHTPGHTMESSSFVILDGGKPHCIFTGDCLFLGEVGRPDLAVKGKELTCEDLAGFLYDSLNNVIRPLPDSTIVYPGHGPGSSCGKKISSGTHDLLGNQKKTNYALLIKDRKEFIQTLTSNLPMVPPYFLNTVSMNKTGYQQLSDIIDRENIPLTIKQFKQCKREGHAIIDTRDKYEFLNGFIKGSYSIDLKNAFASWVGKLISTTDYYVIITDEGKEYETLVRMCRVGFDKCVGFLKGGFNTWKNDGNEVSIAGNIKVEAFEEIMNNKPADAYFLDVRDINEKEKGFVTKFDNMVGMWSMEKLFKAGENVLDKNNTIYCMCQGGIRSVAAVSILRKYGFERLVNIDGGFDAIKTTKIEITYP